MKNQYVHTCWLGLGLGGIWGLGLGQPSAPEMDPMLSTQSSGSAGEATREGLREGDSALSPEVRGVQGDQGDRPLGMSTGSQESAPPGCTCTVTGTCACTLALSCRRCGQLVSTLKRLCVKGPPHYAPRCVAYGGTKEIVPWGCPQAARSQQPLAAPVLSPAPARTPERLYTAAVHCKGGLCAVLEVRGVQGDLPRGMSTGSQESAPPGCTCTVTGTCTCTLLYR